MPNITLDPDTWYYFLFNLDQYLELIFANNWKTFFIAFAILVGLAKVSPWTWDEAVLNVIREAVAGFLPTRDKAPIADYKLYPVSDLPISEIESKPGKIEPMPVDKPVKKTPAKK